MRTGGTAALADRCATSEATVETPTPAVSDQNATVRPAGNPAGRAGVSGSSGASRPVASRISASAICATGDASSQERQLTLRSIG